jgi:glyoxylase-like metal-dependent hydrolase (beta-lactamase superfamily II)
MKEVLPGIYQITLTLSGFSPGSVNTYLFRDNKGYLIIDTGWDAPASLESLEKQMSELGAGLGDIKRVIITHAHVDHFGLIPRLKHSYQAKIYFHQKELDLIKFRYSHGNQLLSSMDQFLQQYGVPKSELTPPKIQIPASENLSSTPADVLFQGGEKIPVGEYTLKVINTPGHTPGHVAFYEPGRKILFSGDTLLPTIATNAALHIQHFRDSLLQYRKSLLSLKELDIDLVFPGHEHAFSNHRQRIDELLKRHQEKTKEIRLALADGLPKTAYEVSRIISWSPQTGAASWNNLSSWDKRFAVLQTIAYLEILVSENLLTGFSQNGKLYYRYVGQYPT